jgi:regulatory protein
VDQEFVCGVDQTVVVKLRLVVGQEMTSQDLKTIALTEEFNRAKEKCLRLLDRRARTQKELADRMQRYGFDLEVSKRVLERLRALKLVDDAAFARAYIQERVRLQCEGRRRLYAGLLKRGIAPELIEAALFETLETDESQACELAAKKKCRAYTGLPIAVAHRRLIAFLGRKGFDFETIRPIVRKVLPDNDG